MDITGVDLAPLYQQLFGRCGQWYPLAREVGWSIEEWETLSKVMWRESRCDPNAWNGHDAGLMQINQIHTKHMEQYGYQFPTSMFLPETNLTYALDLWNRAGWEPWTFKGVTPG